jgi:hypothetical protein
VTVAAGSGAEVVLSVTCPVSTSFPGNGISGKRTDGAVGVPLQADANITSATTVPGHFLNTRDLPGQRGSRIRRT